MSYWWYGGMATSQGWDPCHRDARSCDALGCDALPWHELPS